MSTNLRTERQIEPTRNMFMLYDNKSKMWHTPFFQKSKVEAIRYVIHISSPEDSILGKYKNDFELYYVGDHFERTGEISIEDPPEFMGTLKQLTETTENWSKKLTKENNNG